jgi:hypothetical protein
MSKKTVFICDGPECGAVLVNPGDGVVISGKITDTNTDKPVVLIDGEQKQDVAYCLECLKKALKT